jgi:hypothetical protein
VVFYLYSAIGVPRGIVRKEEVLDSWGVLIENGRGRAEEIFREAERFIAESKVPGVEAERREMAPGIIKGLLGEKRDFLVVKNKNLFRYQILIGARDYGSNLDVSWYLTYRLSFFDRLLSFFRLGREIIRSSADLDLFEQQDLIAFATNCHHCLLKAVEKLMQSLNQDPSKINRRSRGFLGIS